MPQAPKPVCLPQSIDLPMPVPFVLVIVIVWRFQAGLGKSQLRSRGNGSHTIEFLCFLLALADGPVGEGAC